MIETSGRVGATAKSDRREPAAITAAGLRELLERQEYRCAMSGRTLTPDTASVDHIHPLSAGGSNTLDNIQIVHADVNQAKGSMSLERFLGMCREVIAWVDLESRSPQ